MIRLKNGDILAFDELYKLYSHKLFSFVFRILKDEADSDDIVQEVFLKIWEYREKLGDYKLLNSFIFTLAYNNSISIIRKRISSAKTGEPIVRNLEYEFPNQGFEDCKDQFMLGDSILVAPMLESGTSREVIFPEGTWKDKNNVVIKGPIKMRFNVALDDLLWFKKN